VNLVFRLLWLLLVARFRRRCDVLGPVRTPFRVLPTDLDVQRHVNNGIYFSLLDLGRTDLLVRSGLAGRVRERCWYPVVTAESIRFRRSLSLFQRFHVETRVVGWDETTVYLDQRFLRGDEEVASALVAGRFLGPAGSVPPTELMALVGMKPGSPPPMPRWVQRLAEAQAALGTEPPVTAPAPDPGDTDAA
jgi:acyl-CoA thioesterase FadM